MPNPTNNPKRLAPVAVLRRLRVSELLSKSPVGAFWQGLVESCLDAYEGAEWKIDDRVTIASSRPGTIVSVYPRLSGVLAYVVEHDDGATNIYEGKVLSPYTESPILIDDSAPEQIERQAKRFPLPYFNQRR